ncbi:MAG: universal stress protein [Planctomycetia bacterium]|nr:universal stress protein [Planctomycetia bacterium]
MLHIDSILHPTDFSAHSEHAFRLACSLARDHQSRLVILHVAATLGPEQVTMGEAMTQLEPEGHRARLRDELHQVKSPDPRLTVEYRLAEGDPAAEIIRAAADLGCGLIVLGTHGRTGLQRLLMGSVAEQVSRKASCPVLTVKSPLPLAET